MVVELFLCSVAGAATAAVAFRFGSARRPRIPSVGASSRIKSQLHALHSQKRILEKSIARLYSDTMGLGVTQRDNLLIDYQGQLGLINTHIERLVNASAHPDLGALGDGLSAVLDEKLANLETKFGDLSAKIATQTVSRKESLEPKTKLKEIVKKPDDYKIPQDLPSLQKGERIEITTLTSIPSRNVPLEPLVATIPTSFDVTQQVMTPHDTPQTPSTPSVQEPRIPSTPSTPNMPLEPKIEPITPASGTPPPKVYPPIIPPPTKDEDLDIDDEDDTSISRIKKEIQTALEKIQQAEVE